MNSESPLRISSMVLTVGCILCCITAASYLAPKVTPRPSSTDPAIVAANALQMNLSEFQTRVGGDHILALSHQPALTSRPPDFSASKPPAIASASATLLKSPMATPHADGKHTLQKSSRDYVQTTSIERSTSPWAAQEHSVPQFYAPVTVHPVTVNIDNAGIIREISRVHKRLDSLSAEAKTAAQSGASLPVAATPASVQQTNAPLTENSSQYTVHSEQANQTPPGQPAETDRPVGPAAESPPAPAPKPVPTRLPTTKPRMSVASPAADATFAAPATQLLVTPPPIPVSDPAPKVTVTSPPSSALEPMTGPKPEVQFPMTPRQPVPDIPIFEPPALEPPAVEPESADSASLPSVEFSAEQFSVPRPTDALDTIPQNEEQLLSIPADDFVEPMTWIAPAVPVQQPVMPEVATLLIPISHSAKRTTDPPFMNGLSPRVPVPPAQVASRPIGAVQPVRAVQRVSHTTLVPRKHTTQSDCRNCATDCAADRQAKTPPYRIHAVTPAQTFHRIKAALSF